MNEKMKNWQSKVSPDKKNENLKNWQSEVNPDEKIKFKATPIERQSL